MIEDASQVPEGSTLNTDVCVVGSGAAGLTLAREFEKSGLSVLILESGGLNRDEEIQKLYRGEARGLLSSAVNYGRLRYFGGTTNHWAGMVRPMDPLDFQERPWVPNSGWPFQFETLAPYYERAAKLLRLAPPTHSVGHWFENLAEFSPLRGEGIRSKGWQRKDTRFGGLFRKMLEKSKSIRVILHANAEEIIPSKNGGRVEHIQVRTLTGKQFIAKARAYVIACGGIENARLLLTSNTIVPEGLGNQNDLVGRFFMDHARGPGNQLIVWFPGASKILELRQRQRVAFGFSEKVLADNKMLNVVIHMRKPFPLFDPSSHQGKTQLAAIGLRQGHVLARLSEAKDAYFSLCHLRAEQAPLPESRVTLGEERDALGMRRVIVDAKLGELNRHTLLKALEVFARALVRTGLGRLHIPSDPEQPADWHGAVGKNHQMGTTRMAASPNQGVVNSDQQVFGLSNLYIAGSSVFPAVGFMNPTFTIVATTQRLADHLKKTLT